MHIQGSFHKWQIWIFWTVGSENDKLSLPSPPAPSLGFSFSRTSSTGSIDILTSSSAHNTGINFLIIWVFSCLYSDIFMNLNFWFMYMCSWGESYIVSYFFKFPLLVFFYFKNCINNRIKWNAMIFCLNWEEGKVQFNI